MVSVPGMATVPDVVKVPEMLSHMMTCAGTFNGKPVSIVSTMME